MRKIIIIGLIALAVILAGLKIIPSMMGERIFKKVVSERMGTNPLADLDDGLHVILIGTGSPLADPTRAGPSTAVMAGGKLYIIDSGGGAVRKMGELGVSPAWVSAAFLTHFHSDHIDGLGELMLQRWAGGAHKRPLPIYGPNGVEQIIEGLNLTYSQDRDYRIAHHGEAVVPRSGFGGKAMPVTLKDSPLIYKDGDLYVSAFSVFHEPVTPAVGYQFQYKDRIVTITGDTKANKTLSTTLFGSDIIISEALNPEMVGVMEKAAANSGLKNVAKIMHDIPDYHISPEDAATLAQEAGTKKLVLTHIVPALPNKALHKYFLGDAKSKFDGDIIIGEDGMVFSLPADSNEIKSSRLK